MQALRGLISSIITPSDRSSRISANASSSLLLRMIRLRIRHSYSQYSTVTTVRRHVSLIAGSSAGAKIDPVFRGIRPSPRIIATSFFILQLGSRTSYTATEVVAPRYAHTVPSDCSCGQRRLCSTDPCRGWGLGREDCQHSRCMFLSSRSDLSTTSISKESHPARGKTQYRPLILIRM